MRQNTHMQHKPNRDPERVHELRGHLARLERWVETIQPPDSICGLIADQVAYRTPDLIRASCRRACCKGGAAELEAVMGELWGRVNLILLDRGLLNEREQAAA